MLTEEQKQLLLQKTIPLDDIEKMESFDENTLIATFKDGTQKQVTEGVYSRIMGYFRRVEDANIGKRQEFSDRKYFSERKAVERFANAGATLGAAE